MNNHYEDLIQRELDNDLSSREQAELLAAVASDPEARAFRNEMLSLGLELDSLANRKPAAGLKHDIMTAIAADPAPVAPRLRRTPTPTRGFDRRQALAFAAGITVVLVAGQVLPLFGEPPIDANQAAGTLMPPSAELIPELIPKPVPEPVEIDRGRIEAGSTRLEAWTERSGDHLFLRARGEMDAGAPVRIDWDGELWSVVSVRSIPATDLALDRGRADFVQAEPGPFSLEMELQLRGPTPGAGDVRLRAGGPGPDVETITLGTAP